jgi:hypothetical protein
MTKALTVTIPSQGSGTGISYWDDWYSCPMKGFLNDTEGRPPSKDPNLLIGTGVHALDEIYFKGGKKMRGFDTAVVEFKQKPAGEWDASAAIRQKADTIFRKFRLQCPPNYFGKVNYVEKRLVLPLKSRPDWAPDGMPLTAKIDLAVSLGAKNVRQLKEDHSLELASGLCLVDHKTAWADSPMLAWQWALSLQFPFYMLMWQKIMRRKVKGLLVNVMTKNSYKWLVYHVPFPSKRGIAIVSHFLEGAWANYHQDPPECRPNRCMDWHRPCHWAVTNKCRRS